MSSIFISYRRDDASGQAGRLFDRLTARFGADAVFMDVSDLQPGQDFVSEIARALRTTDVLLAVIGPQWAGAVGDAGRRRLDDPDDFVRREVETALRRGARTIPVLVRGARMPGAAALPESLRPLARLQAIELSDNRWESDVRALIAALGPAAPDAKGALLQAEPEDGAQGRAAASARQRKWNMARLASAVVGVVVVASVLWFWRESKSTKVETPSSVAAAVDGERDARRRNAELPQPSSGAGMLPASPARSVALALPDTTEVRFRSVAGEVVYRILAIRAEPRDADSVDLAFLVRMYNHGSAGQNFWDSSFGLSAGARRLEPASSLNLVVSGHAAREGEVHFTVPASLENARLEIAHLQADRTSIPIDLRVHEPIPADGSTDAFGRPRPVRVVDVVRPLPAPLPAGQRVRVGRSTFEVVSADIERATVERAELRVTVRCTVTPDAYGMNFWSDSVRLVADGVSRAPENDVNEVVSGGASKEATFVFALEALPAVLELWFFDAGETGRTPVDLASVTALRR